jgi:hypothetical protein
VSLAAAAALNNKQESEHEEYEKELFKSNANWFFLN